MIKHPDFIEKEMLAYRFGITGIPENFIRFHQAIAAYDLQHRNWKVIQGPTLESDGWLDGCKFLTVVIETYPGNFCRLQWHASGAWFRQGAGWTRAYEMLDKTKEFIKNVDWKNIL